MSRRQRCWFSFAIHEWRPTTELTTLTRTFGKAPGLSMVRRRHSRLRTLSGAPDSISALGKKASEYANALARLDQLGSPEAHEALAALTNALSGIGSPTLSRDGALKQLKDADSCPVNIHPTARWKMDDAGQFALELLLWLWRARQIPRRYGRWGECAHQLPFFEIDTAEEWWALARGVMTDSYQKPQTLPELRALAVSQNSRSNAMAARNEIVRKLRDRFASFARPR
jgi:hypothetical protein